MIEIDGSQGEGGGQILRSALALSMATGRPVTLGRIRAGRKRPGLLRQHLTAVNAAAEICGADVKGNALGSSELRFVPSTVKHGDYHFSVGTAGSCTLVLQTILPALGTADGPSNVTLEGGTHNPMAPPFDFLAKAFLPVLERMGPKATATLEIPGFYPAGGGRFNVRIVPAEKLRPLELDTRGELKRVHARAVVANLSPSIARRELNEVHKRLQWPRDCLQVEQLRGGAGPGNAVILTVESDHVTEVFTGFGEMGVRAERVAAHAAKEAQAYLASGVPVGPHLADQLLVPLAMAGGGTFRTVEPTEHTRTNAGILRAFLDVDVAFDEHKTNDWRVTVHGHAARHMKGLA